MSTYATLKEQMASRIQELEAELNERNNPGIEITVEIGYRDYSFGDIEEALQFAKLARKSTVKDDEITITIKFKEESKDDKEVQEA